VVWAAHYRRWFWPKLPPSIRKHLPPPSADNAATRSNAALLLGMGHDEQRTILALAGALKKDDDPGVRWNAAWALGNLGNRNRTAVAALSEALKDKDPALRNEATNVLLHLDPATAARAGVKVPSP
jgi:HEAT repeat protein